MRPPLNHMRIRSDSLSHTFAGVRVKKDGSKYRHQGWDLEAPVGTPVYAIAKGKIVGVRDKGLYGKQLILKFSDRDQTRYAFYGHLSTILMREGSDVQEGEMLGFTGTTGNAQGLPRSEEHLHFEVRTSPYPGTGLTGHVDPGSALGYEVYSCHAPNVEPYEYTPRPPDILECSTDIPPWKVGR